MTHGFSAYFAGIGFRFSADFPFDVPAEFQPFLVDSLEADERFTLSAITEPLRFDAPPLCSGTLNAYRTSEGVAREYPYLRAPDGCCAVTLLRSNGENTIYLPQSDLSRYQSNFSLSVILGAEAILLRHDALLLHSSAVRLGGRAVLFCGAPGAGKSTQAALWEQLLGAEIINGDRCVIAQRPDSFYGCGSPYCGSSGIRRPIDAPIAGIVLLNKDTKNALRRVPAGEAFRRLLRELTVNSYDDAFMERCLSLLSTLVAQIPVYELSCRPDAEAVQLTKSEVLDRCHES